MPITTYANNPNTTATAVGGGSISSSATSITVSSSSSFPAASNTAVPATQFHIADPAVPGELITVTNVSGTTWTIARGAEGTTAASHASGATFYQVVSAGDLTAMKQASSAISSFSSPLSNSATETVVCTYTPVTGEIVAGTTFELMASGLLRATSLAGSQLTWRIRWGGLSGTVLLIMVGGSSAGSTGSATGVYACGAFSTAMTVTQGVPFDINGTVTFVSTTSATANLNFWYGQGTGTCGTGVASNGVAITGLTAPPGGGPLVLTAQWTSASTGYVLSIPAPAVYRAA